jgi:ABC-2 type transport system ATP-binding protein
VGLAQAMIHEPDILVLDEPTSGSTPADRGDRGLIKEIGREKRSSLRTSCPRCPPPAAVIIIANGKLVGSGTPGDLAARATGGVGVSVVLVGRGEDLDAGLRTLDGAKEVEFASAEGDALRYRIQARDGVDAARLAEAVSGLAALRGWRLRELRPEAASLEDVFRELTTREDGQ